MLFLFLPLLLFFFFFLIGSMGCSFCSCSCSCDRSHKMNFFLSFLFVERFHRHFVQNILHHSHDLFVAQQSRNRNHFVVLNFLHQFSLASLQTNSSLKKSFCSPIINSTFDFKSSILFSYFASFCKNTSGLNPVSKSSLFFQKIK
jgi:hypothetical protein